MAMRAIDTEAIGELAMALHQPYDLEPVDTGLVGGDMFVYSEPLEGPAFDGELRVLAPSTLVCWVMYLGVDRHPFRDPVAAMIYLRVLGVRDET